MAEFFQSLPKKQHSVVWSSLLNLTRLCVGLEEKAEDVSASNVQVCAIIRVEHSEGISILQVPIK